MKTTAKRTKRASAPVGPQMTNEQILALLSAGVAASKSRNYKDETTHVPFLA